MAIFKRTTQKTGPNRRRTVTQSSKGTTVSDSTSYGDSGKTRITRSINLTTGKSRSTHTQHTGGGWTIVRDITPKFGSVSKTRGTRRKSKSSGGLFFWLIAFFLLIVFLG